MKKKIIIILLCVILISPIFASGKSVDSFKTQNINITNHKKFFNNFLPIIKFESILEIDYDRDEYNNINITPDGATFHVPLIIQYKCIIPDFLLRTPFLKLKNLFVFGSIISSMQEINLSIVNEPNWAEIWIPQQSVWIDIDNEFIETSTSLLIKLNEYAPAGQYNLQIKGETRSINRVSDTQSICHLSFNVNYQPSISIYSVGYINTTPGQKTYEIINITNRGNDKTTVRHQIIEKPINWSVQLYPDQIDIEVNETRKIYIEIMPPNNLYYYNFQKTIYLSFTPSSYSKPEEEGDPLFYDITAFYKGYVNGNGSEDPKYSLFCYEWFKFSQKIVIGDNIFVDKQAPYYDIFSINSPTSSIITVIEVLINWEDDNTYGILRKKGEDTLTISITDENGVSKTESSIGGGNLSFQFNSINDIPSSDCVLAEDISNAMDIMDGMVAGENKFNFNIEVDVENGERLFRPLKFLMDKGNDFDVKVNFIYYMYEFHEIEDIYEF